MNQHYVKKYIKDITVNNFDVILLTQQKKCLPTRFHIRRPDAAQIQYLHRICPCQILFMKKIYNVDGQGHRVELIIFISIFI